MNEQELEKAEIELVIMHPDELKALKDIPDDAWIVIKRTVLLMENKLKKIANMKPSTYWETDDDGHTTGGYHECEHCHYIISIAKGGE